MNVFGRESRGMHTNVLEEAALVDMEGRPAHSSSLGPSKVPATRPGDCTIAGVCCLAGESTKCAEEAV